MFKNHCVLQYNRALGHVMLSTKIDKNQPNILQKTAPKSMLQLGSILEPTWLHFGRVLGAKMGPSWLQMAKKSIQNTINKNDHLLDRLKIDFCWIVGINLAPKSGNQPLHVGAFFLLGTLLGPRCPQDPSEPPLEIPKAPPRGLLAPILEDFGVHCWFLNQLE